MHYFYMFLTIIAKVMVVGIVCLMGFKYGL